MLVTCQTCSNRISESAEACPSCKASGDAAFGPQRPCLECGAAFRPSMQSCQSCGAPVLVALGKPTADEIVDLPTLGNLPWASNAEKVIDHIGGPRNPEVEPPPRPVLHERVGGAPAAEPSSPTKMGAVRQKPGFARGKFGKAMAYPLFVVGVLGVMISIREWSTSWHDQPPGYGLGQVMGMVCIAGAAIRALLRRSHRTLLDWFLAFFLFLPLGGSVFSVVVTLISPNLYIDGSMVFYFMLGALIIVSSFVVIVRLLRQPYHETKMDVSADQPNTT